MTISRFNQQWLERGRAARLEQELLAVKNNLPVYLPESSYHATAASYWREGWNSVSLADIRNHISTALSPSPNQLAQNHITNIKQRLGRA